MDDLFCVADDRDIGAVRHHDDLAALLDVLDDRDEQLADCLAVEVFLWLVDDDRLVALVDEQVEDEDERSPGDRWLRSLPSSLNAGAQPKRA